MKPKYPVYIISKGRSDCCYTARFMVQDELEFTLVVEPQEADDYIKKYGKERVRVLPFSNLGLGGIPARNWCWEDAKARGAEWHWIFDDNIRMIRRRHNSKRIRCNSNNALSVVEAFVDRYTNIALAGLNYQTFVQDVCKVPPFRLNVHVYSCLLIRNDLPYRWRGRYNEDTDLCLQVLSNNWCTILVNQFVIDKMTTMKMKGGNSTELYKGDGRLKMSRALERMWNGVVKTVRRFDRPQHKVAFEWGRFDTQLIKKVGLVLPKGTNEFGMDLQQVRDEIKSPLIRSILANKPSSKKNSSSASKKIPKG